ncbi:hypothetical protein [Brachybacterium sacelli]
MIPGAVTRVPLDSLVEDNADDQIELETHAWWCRRRWTAAIRTG